MNTPFAEAKLVFGPLEVDPVQRTLVIAGRVHRPGARAFSLLLYLIEHRDRVVGKAELMQKVWPGLVVEENNLTVQVSALRKLIGPDLLATFSGRGYRFMHTLPAAAEAAPEVPLPERPSIAVLPLLHLADDATQAFITDSITEDLITELARFRSLFVIARNSSFVYQGRAVDVRTVAREQGVRYVLEGSVRLGAGRLRITAQLIDAEAGAHVWADRFDGTLQDLFDIQDEVVRCISVAVAQGVEQHEFRSLRRRPLDWGAYAVAVQAYQQASDAFNRHDQALRLAALARAREALALDAQSTVALSALLLVLWQLLFFVTADDREATLVEALALLDRWQALEPMDAMVHNYRGLLLQEAGQPAAALASLQQAFRINPNDVRVLGSLGLQEVLCNQLDAAEQHLLMARRIAPLDPWAWSPNAILALAYLRMSRLDDALHYAELSLSQAPAAVAPRMTLAIARHKRGDAALAAEAMLKALAHGTPFVEGRAELLRTAAALNPHAAAQWQALAAVLSLLDDAALTPRLRQVLQQQAPPPQAGRTEDLTRLR
jgi:TolB-like protein